MDTRTKGGGALPWGWWLRASTRGLKDDDGIHWQTVREAFWQGKLGFPASHFAKEQLELLLRVLTAIGSRWSNGGEIHRVRKRWSVTDHAADEWADRVAIAQENQKRKVEMRRAVKAILQSLPEREIASFDLGRWWSLPHPTIGISLAEAVRRKLQQMLHPREPLQLMILQTNCGAKGGRQQRWCARSRKGGKSLLTIVDLIDIPL